MKDSDYIIPRKYAELSISSEIDKAQREKHAVAIYLASHFLHMPFQFLLDQPTLVAMAKIRSMNIIDPKLLALHAVNFPNRYTISHDVSTHLLALVYDQADRAALEARKAQRSVDMQAPIGVIVQLLMAGADPLITLFHPHVTAIELESYLGFFPAARSRSYQGYTVGHAQCLSEGFIEEKLPVLLRHQTDINSVSRAPPIGTITHLMLADEQQDVALSFIGSPLTRGRLDPTKRDGEGKTIPIIAAKVRAESVLLMLADFYPQKLAFEARDAQERALMHYCFGLGLIGASHRFADLGANLQVKDGQDRSPKDYLALSQEETGEILRSIEIHPDRDAGAQRNAIIGQKKNSLPILVDGLPVLATTENFTAQVTASAFDQFGEEGVKLVADQRARLRNVSLLQEILNNRAQLKFECDNGLFTATRNGRRRGRPSAPSSQRI